LEAAAKTKSERREKIVWLGLAKTGVEKRSSKDNAYWSPGGERDLKKKKVRAIQSRSQSPERGKPGL